jgi:hypothetical protein
MDRAPSYAGSMGPQFSFTQQFFAVSSTLPESRVLLAGGLDPISGPRSAYRASVACYDYAAGRVVWLAEKSNWYPFRAITHTPCVCAALLPQNFTRCPQGVFRFDLESGEPISPDFEVRGWKIQFVDAVGERLVFSWVGDETSRVRAVEGRGSGIQERSFPYHSTSGGKMIERVIAVGGEKFVAVFGFVKGRRVVYSVEEWGWDSAAPRWQSQTLLRNAVRNESVVMFWGCSGSKLDVEILSLANGALETSFRLALADVVSIQPVTARSYAILSISGIYVLDAVSKSLSQVPGWENADFLDFGSVAVDAALGKVIVVTAGNFQRPGTTITVLDFPSDVFPFRE